MFWIKLLASPKAFFSWVKWSKEKNKLIYIKKMTFCYKSSVPWIKIQQKAWIKIRKLNESGSTTMVNNSEKMYSITWSRAPTERRSEPRPQQSELAYYISLQAAKRTYIKLKKNWRFSEVRT